MCTVVFYRKRIRERLYPVKARTGPYAFANDVTRVGGKVTSKYVGILQVPEGKRVGIIETGPSENVVETKLGTVVIETKAGNDVVETERGRARTSPVDPRRFSKGYSDFRVSETESETRFLATGNYYGVHLERNVLAVLSFMVIPTTLNRLFLLHLRAPPPKGLSPPASDRRSPPNWRWRTVRGSSRRSGPGRW